MKDNASSTIRKASPMRKSIAKHMHQSWGTYPMVTYQRSVDMTDIAQQKKLLLNKGEKHSYTDFIAHAVSALLLDFPLINCYFNGDIEYHSFVNLGIAVALEDGLLVPVIKNAHEKSLNELSVEIKRLTGLARNRKLSVEHMNGGTFTITNLGMFGINTFNPIINHPQSAILGVTNIMDTPVAREGAVVIRPITNLCLTADHRVVDGSVAADFLQRLARALEQDVLPG